jgi:hypothetical protein
VVSGRGRAAYAVGRRGGSTVRPVHHVGIHFYAHTRAHRVWLSADSIPAFCVELRGVFRVPCVPRSTGATANQCWGT